MPDKINIVSSKQILIVCAVLTVVTFAVYWQVKGYSFVNIDDPIYVVNNSSIKSGISPDGIHWAFSTNYLRLWIPLTWLSLMLDYRIFGLNPGGYHLTNLILHIFSTLLLFGLFFHMTKEIWKSAFVAALFALHPLHVESVAWIAERKDVLSAFFWMLTLCLYVHYTEKPAIKRYLPVLFSFILALLSKPMVVTLPFIMILLDYWPLKRFSFHKGNFILWQLREKIVFILLSLIIVIRTLYGPVEKFALYPDIIPLSIRIPNAPVSFATYLEKIFWPHDLSILYPFSEISFLYVFGALFLISIISIAVFVTAKQKPYLAAGWVWYSITILPVIGIIQAGNESMADRYTYLPSIGIFIMLAWGIPGLIPQEKIRKKILRPAGISVLIILAA